MEFKVIESSTLLLRIFTFIALVSSVVVFLLNNVSVEVVIKNLTFATGTKVTFEDVMAYRYVLSTAVLGATYTLLQLPFAACHICTEKRMRNGCLPEFDFYGDKVICFNNFFAITLPPWLNAFPLQIMSFFLATAVGAGCAVTLEFKPLLNNLYASAADSGVEGAEKSKHSYDEFLDKGTIATVLLSLGFASMAVLSILSSIKRPTRKGWCIMERPSYFTATSNATKSI